LRASASRNTPTSVREAVHRDEAKGFDRENCRAQSLILIFDEPTVGLDVLNAIEVQEAIQELRNDGRTVISRRTS